MISPKNGLLYGSDVCPKGNLMRHKVIAFILFILLFFVITGCTSPIPSPTPAVPTTPTKITPQKTQNTPTQTDEPDISAQIDKYLTSLVKLDRFSGSVLAAKDGKVLINQGYGFSDAETKELNTPQKKFQIGSLTKQFTAMAILLLQQQRKIDVKDPVCKYVDDCPEAWQDITIHHLLTHTSGIPDFGNAPDILEFARQSVTPDQIIDRFHDLPLDFKPGEKFSYSNSGYSLLGYTIEKVSGMTYAEFLDENIFIPLKMQNSGFEANRQAIVDRAIGYPNKSSNADDINNSTFFSSGGLHSTVEDLYTWAQAISTDQLIPQSLREVMFTPFVSIPDSEASYGYGWGIGQQFGHAWIGHAGSVPGFQSEIDRYPEDGVVIILLSNREDTNLGLTASELTKMILTSGEPNNEE
jgi:CubicO group peptidase (beta-lactamase class C family)